ncbi:MAG: N-acyl homoserine lactonase family protein [Pseudomonadota bacterium]
MRVTNQLMSSTEPDRSVESVQAFTTGAAQQHKEHRFGSRAPKIWWALTSRSWIEIPINVFVIKHQDGQVLFDTGLDPAVNSDPHYVHSAIGRFFMRRVFRFDIGPDDTVTANLMRLNLRAEDVSTVVVSHLHFDHIGGIGDVPQAELLVSRDEWEQLSGPHPDRDYFFREHIILPGAKWRPIDFASTDDPILAPFGGCYDVMGDGALILIPTPGHTRGSLSMLIRTQERPPLLLIGDLSYSPELLMRDQLPGIFADKSQLAASYAKVRTLKSQLPDLVILGSHDPAAIDLLQDGALFR